MNELNIIREELASRKGKIRRISKEVGISYDTVRRIALDPEYEPGFRKIERLAHALGMRVAIIK